MESVKSQPYLRESCFAASLEKIRRNHAISKGTSVSHYRVKLTIVMFLLSFCGCSSSPAEDDFQPSRLMMPRKLTDDKACSVVTMPKPWTLPRDPSQREVRGSPGDQIKVGFEAEGSILLRSYSAKLNSEDSESGRVYSEQIARLSGEPPRFDSYVDTAIWEAAEMAALRRHTDLKLDDFEYLDHVDAGLSMGEIVYWQLPNTSKTLLAVVSYRGENPTLTGGGGGSIFTPSRPLRIPTSTVFFRLLSLRQKKLISEFVMEKNSGLIQSAVATARWAGENVFFMPWFTFVDGKKKSDLNSVLICSVRGQ